MTLGLVDASHRCIKTSDTFGYHSNMTTPATHSHGALCTKWLQCLMFKHIIMTHKIVQLNMTFSDLTLSNVNILNVTHVAYDPMPNVILEVVILVKCDSC